MAIRIIRHAVLGAFLTTIGAPGHAAAQTLVVVVTDPSGAVIPGAIVTMTRAGISVTTGATDSRGQYRAESLAVGKYAVRVASPAFGPFQIDGIELTPGRTQTLNARLYIQREADTITVTDQAGLSVDPTQNAGQIVLRGSDLDSLSDDAEDLANDLQMLAGPAPGPEGPQMYIDGFEGGRMPPKQSIREIRVNSNPFSAEFDRVGFGRIEVFTKPGANQYHGQATFDFANRALTARNPYLAAPVVPGYQQEMFSGNLSGPVTKKASFFLDIDRRITDENALLNYVALDAGLNPVSISAGLVAPSRRLSLSPRVDYSLTPNNTLILRYSWLESNARNQGITTQAFDQPSRAYGIHSTEQGLQITESAIVGRHAENDIRFQFYRTRSSQEGVSAAPEVDVQGAFTGGGTFPLNYTDRDRFEFQNSTIVIRGSQTVKFGGRLRDDRLRQQSQTNFNGRFVFSAVPGGASAIDVYLQNQRLAMHGMSQAQIAGLGFGPSEFLLTSGRPLNGASLFDVGVFVQDDWRVRPNLSLSGGLRYELQGGISDRTNFAPRIGVGWAPAGRHGKTAKTVVRAGAGMFYDRFTSDLLLNATQFNGVNQTQVIIRSPAFFPNIPDPTTLAGLVAQQGGSSARAVYQIDPHFRVPYVVETAVGIERELPHNLSMSVNYTYTRGLHQFRTRDINAPRPTVVDALGRATGTRPLGNSAGDIYQYEGSGIYRQH
ncbi:MAG TPA: carboxypeptidase regulatory-like domain-containing protein, partial [Bryobacteraceae bacterium]|nr:carboxypeptidase regulatory-like domain-containing protein [Bryobacteraceae bacterium]